MAHIISCYKSTYTILHMCKFYGNSIHNTNYENWVVQLFNPHFLTNKIKLTEYSIKKYIYITMKIIYVYAACTAENRHIKKPEVATTVQHQTFSDHCFKG